MINDYLKENWLAITTMTVICIAVLGSVAIQAGCKNQKPNNPVAAKLLVNQIEERQKRAGKVYDFDEWLTIHNKHLEKRYNLLLEFWDPELSNLVKAQETCLIDLTYYKQNNATAEIRNDQADLCNKIGEDIDARLLVILNKEIRGETQ